MKHRYSTTIMLALVFMGNSAFAQADGLTASTSTRCLQMNYTPDNNTGNKMSRDTIALSLPAHANLTSKQEFPPVDKFLTEGRLAEGETALLAQLKAVPTDDQSRFGLGFLQVVLAVEDLGQDLYRFGLRDPSHGRFSQTHETGVMPHMCVSREKVT